MKALACAAPALLLLLAGCSGTDSTPSPAADASPATSAGAAKPATGMSACEIVTGAEMSAILGAAVGANEGQTSEAKTDCTYHPPGTVSPFVELAIEWGSGEAGMAGAGIASKMEPGVADPYAGLGDQAFAVGPTLMIRNGADLVRITTSDVDDVPAAARRIFATARTRM